MVRKTRRTARVHVLDSEDVGRVQRYLPLCVVALLGIWNPSNGLLLGLASPDGGKMEEARRPAALRPVPWLYESVRLMCIRRHAGLCASSPVAGCPGPPLFQLQWMASCSSLSPMLHWVEDPYPQVSPWWLVFRGRGYCVGKRFGVAGIFLKMQDVETAEGRESESRNV